MGWRRRPSPPGGLRLLDGKLSCADAEGDRRLAQMVAATISATGDGSRWRRRGDPGAAGLALPCFGGDPGHAAPSGDRGRDRPAGAMQRRQDALRARFHLTQAEVAMTMAILETGSRKLAAERRGVSVATARAQLTSIFDKTARPDRRSWCAS